MSLVLCSSLAACSSTSTVRATAPPAKASRDAARAGNERVLTAAQSQRLIDWANDFRSCLSRRGINVAKPEPAPKQITLRVTDAPPGSLMQPVVQCGDSLGGPPPKSSLQLADARTYVLYLPKRCLLDPNVERAANA